MTHTLALLLLGYLPFRRQFGASIRNLALMAIGALILSFGLALCDMLFLHNTGLRLLSSFCLGLVTAALCAFLIHKSFFFHVFLVFMSKSYLDNLWFLASTLIQHFFPTGDQFWTEPLFWVLLLLVSIFPITSISIRKNIGSIIAMNLDSKFWSCLCIVPIGIFFLYRVAINPHYLGLTSQHLPLITSILWPHLCSLSYFVVFRMCHSAVETDQLVRKVRIANLAAEVKAKQNERLNHMNIQAHQEQLQMLEWLQELRLRLQQGDHAGAERFLSEWLGHIDNVPLEHVCDNTGVNAFVQQYLQWAKPMGIRTEVRLALPACLPISELDYFVVLGNLLENALEACAQQAEGERFLTLNSRLSGSSLLISVTNSYSGAIATQGDAFCSSKQQGRMGLGIASVRAVASRYDGFSRFRYGAGVFEASVLLNTQENAGGMLS